MSDLINGNALLEVCDGDQDMAEILLETFVEESESQISNLNAAYESENWKDYVVYVHGMKSSSRSVGALISGDLAYELEMAGKNGDIAVIKEKHDAFLSIFQNSVEAASNFSF